MTFERIVEYFGTRGLKESAVRDYLAGGGDVNRRDAKMGWTLLHFAAENRDVGIIRLLVEHGADVRAADRNGWTALHVAVDSDLDNSRDAGRKVGDLPTVRVMIEVGADEMVRAVNGITARDVAREYGEEELFEKVVMGARGKGRNGG